MSDSSFILYYKKKIENHINQDEVVFDSIAKIGNIPVTADILRETGIADFLHQVASKKTSYNHQNIYAKAHSVLKKWRAEKLWDYPVSTHRRISSHHEAGPSRLSQGSYANLNTDSTPSSSQNVNPRPCLAPKNYHSKAKHGSIPQVFKSDRDSGQNHISVDPNKHYSRDKSNSEWDNDSVLIRKSFNNSNRISDSSRHQYHDHSNPERDTGQNHHSSIKNNHHSDPSRQYRDRDGQNRHSSTWFHHVSDPNRHYHRERPNHRRDSGTVQNRNPSSWNDRISDSSRHHRRDQRNHERELDGNKVEESLDVSRISLPMNAENNWPNEQRNSTTLNGPEQSNLEPDHDERSNEDSNDANLNIDNQPEAENAGFIGTTQKPKDPYHLELEEGMFKAIKVEGPPLLELHQNIYDGLRTHLGMNKNEMRDFKSQRNRVSNGNAGIESPKSPDKAADPVKKGLPGSQCQASTSEPNTEKKQNLGQKIDTKDNESKKEKPGQELNSKILPPKKVDGKTSSHTAKTVPSSTDANQKVYDKKTAIRKLDHLDESTMIATSSKKERRAIYSGKKSSEVPKLKELVIHKIQRNLDILKYLQDTMCYKHIKPLLETFPPMKLFKIEENYKFLVKYTDDLWQNHSRKEYRLNVPGPDESWRNFYLRCHKEANNKLKNVTAQISASASKVKPDRQAKLTTVDSPVEPPAKRLKSSDHPTVKPSTPLVSSKTLPPVVTPKTPVNMNSAHPGSSKTLIATTPKPSMKETKSTPKTAKKDAPLMSKVKKTMGHMHRIKRS